MGLASRNPDIPGVSKQATCRKNLAPDGEPEKRCGKNAHNWLKGEVSVMGKNITVKIPVCDDHLKELKQDVADFGIS